MGMEKIIIVRMVKDWIKPYSDMNGVIPKVLISTHPRFVRGTRFDYGYLEVALRDGYMVLILPLRSYASTAKKEVG